MSIKSITTNRVALVAIILLLGLWSAYLMYQLWPPIYLESTQIQRMNDILYGSAPNPWRYRILSEYMVNFIYSIFKWFNSETPIVKAFVTFTFLQFTAIYSLAYLYFRKVNISFTNALIGLAFIAAAVIHSYYDSGLSYSRNIDLIFYLISALCLFTRNYSYLPIVVFLAALNRETSGFIILLPFALLAMGKLSKSRSSIMGKLTATDKQELLKYGVISAIVFVATFFALRYFITGYEDVINAYSPNSALQLFTFNISDPIALFYLPLTFNILPLIGLIRHKSWPKEFVMIYLTIVPGWLIMHLLYTYIHETSLFLVPLAMAVIPSALCRQNPEHEIL